MRFILSWAGSYLKAAMAAAVVFAAAGAIVTFLRGGEVTPDGVAMVAFWIFVGVATAAIVPALTVSAAPELVGIGPNGLLFSIAGAGFALATLAGITLADVREARLLDSSRDEVTAWVSETFHDVPRAHMAVFAFAGAAAGGALAKSRARAIQKQTG